MMEFVFHKSQDKTLYAYAWVDLEGGYVKVLWQAAVCSIVSIVYV